MGDDLARILALPYRPAVPPPGVVEEMTAKLRTPDGTMTLLPVQAWALKELELYGAILGFVGVGGGKTLIALLAGTVLQARRTLLLVPAALRDQMQHNIDTLSRHWRIPEDLHVLSHHQLQSPRGVGVLDKINADLVVVDEAHGVCHLSGPRARRFRKHLQEDPDRKLVALSASLIKRSVRDPAYLSSRSLGAGSPYPRNRAVLESWAEALDPRPDWDTRPNTVPGLGGREDFQRRLVQTPGVIVHSGGRPSAGLIIHERRVSTPAVMVDLDTRLRKTWTAPSGEELTDILQFTTAARELAVGLELVWRWDRGETPQQIRQWLDARSAWNQEVRRTLQRGGRPEADSPALLEEQARSGSWASRTWGAWAAVADTCVPRTESVWHSKYLVEDAVAWGRDRAGVIWTRHAALGPAVAELGGFPYYGPDTHPERDEDGSRTIVCSMCHAEGKQLHRFALGLVCEPPVLGDAWEQLLGRFHRLGQAADDVEFWVYQHTPEFRTALTKARADETFHQQIKGLDRRLSYATYTFTTQ